MPRPHVDPTDGDEGMRSEAPKKATKREAARASLVETARRLAEDMNRQANHIAEQRGWSLEADYSGVMKVWRDQAGAMWMVVGGVVREVTP